MLRCLQRLLPARDACFLRGKSCSCSRGSHFLLLLSIPTFFLSCLSSFLPWQALEILDNEEEVHVPRVLIFDHTASGISREAIHTSLVEGRDVWWQVGPGRGLACVGGHVGKCCTCV